MENIQSLLQNWIEIVLDDKEKDKLTKDNGYKLIRIWENELETVWQKLK